MHILSFSLDPKILDAESVVASRSIRYGQALDSYTIIVPSSEKKKIILSNNVVVYGSGGSTKITQLWNIYKKADEILTKGLCEVITTQDTYFLATLGFFLAKRYHLGLEVQVLGVEKLNWFRKQLSLFTLKRASVIRVLSEGLRERLLSEFEMTDERMQIVPIYVDVSSLGFDTAALSEEERKEMARQVSEFNALYADRFNFISVNRLVPVKNISLQLQAVEKLRDSFPNILLHIVGDGPDKELLQYEIQKRNIASHVILHGPKFGTALSPFFTETDCFILTSHSEGYGMVIVEAATASLPIIMTNVGCAGEVIIQNQSGFIIDDNDVEALTERMKEIIKDSKLRSRLGEAAQHSVESLPSFDEVLQKYVASWEQALKNKL